MKHPVYIYLGRNHVTMWYNIYRVVQRISVRNKKNNLFQQ